MHLAHRFLTHPCSSLFRILVLFMALAPTLMVWCSRSGSTTDEKLDAFLSKFAHFETSSCCHDLDVPCGFTYHENTWILRPDLQRWNRTSAPSLHVCARSRHMQPQHQMLPVRKDLGLHSNKLTAPKPQGPMVQGHLMTIETHDEDSILPQAQKMNNHEVPSYSDSLANKTSKELHSGSIPFGMNLVCWHVTNLLELIAMQAPCQSDSFFETRGKCQDFLVRYKDDGIPKTISPISRSENSLCRCGESWLTNFQLFFLTQMTKVYSSSPCSILVHKSSA